MKRRFVQREDGELVEVGLDYIPKPRTPMPHVMGDISPYRSMIDGSLINSRSQHREHLRQHGCVEVGNDSSLQRGPRPQQVAPGLKETIAREVYSKLRYR